MLIRESESCGKSELDIFSVPPTQTWMEEGRYDVVKPYNNFQTGTVIFEIEGDNQFYIDLSQTELNVKASLRKKGTDTLIESLTSTEAVTKMMGPVNNLFHSMFSQVQVKIGNTEVENTNSHYGYRAYLENLLCYDREAKSTWLQMEGWFQDTAGKFDEITDIAYAKDTGVTSGNLGFYNRRARYTKQGGCFEMKGKIKSDIFNWNRYMLPQVNIQIQLSRASKDFCFMATAANIKEVDFKIDECWLQIRRVKVSQAVALQHAMMLEKQTAKYPIKRVLMKSMAIPYAATSVHLTGIHRGIMPSRVILGFVKNTAYTGSITENPFNFQNLKIKNMKLKVASTALPYSEGITTDYTKGCWTEAYSAMFQYIRTMGNFIDYDDFGKGFTLYPFDLTPDLCSAEHFNLLRDGALEFDVVFESNDTTVMQAIFYMEFDNVIEITKDRAVQFDFNIV
jgi:hypothetical protein